LPNPYSVTSSGSEYEYKFITGSGDHYVAYFSYFTLLSGADGEIEVFSFGFLRENFTQPLPDRIDPRIRATIQYIIADFFKKNGQSAIVYICDQADGKARQRSLLFSRWFSELSDTYIKCDSHARYAEFDFYSSIIIPNTNPDKGKLVDAFYYTLRYWMSE